MEVFRKIDEDTGEFANPGSIQPDGIVSEVSLRLRERPSKLPHDPGKDANHLVLGIPWDDAQNNPSRFLFVGFSGHSTSNQAGLEHLSDCSDLLQSNLQRFNKASEAGWLGNLPHYWENVGNTENTAMPTRKHIEPGTKIGLKLTAAERKLILDDLMCLDDSYAEVIRDTPADQPVEFTLDDWDGLGGFIAAEANHTEDRKAGKKLDAIFNKVQKILDTYTDEEPLKTLKIEDARKAKHPQRECRWRGQAQEGQDRETQGEHHRRNGVPVQDHPQGD